MILFPFAKPILTCYNIAVKITYIVSHKEEHHGNEPPQLREDHRRRRRRRGACRRAGIR